jgi:hypothetical protein
MYRIRAYATDFPNDIKNFTRSNNREIQGETGLRIGVAAGLLSPTQIKSIYPVMVKSNIVPQAMSFSPENYTAILGWLKEYDIGIKTGKFNDSKTGFQILCYKIITIA